MCTGVCVFQNIRLLETNRRIRSSKKITETRDPNLNCLCLNQHQPSMSGLNRSSSATMKNGLPPKELLDDLCSRFVLNVPKEDLQSFERILFLVEYAHWFYEDNSVEQNPSLKSLTLKEFTCLLFNSCDVLRPYVAHIDDIFKDFTSYKVRVPVTGAIILDESYERCLLVKGWKGTSWSFPRGKKNKDEEDYTCAVREVLEETGFDFSNLLNKDEYIEMVFGQQRVRLYIVAGVKDDAAFAPLTKKEISEIAWHRLDELQPASADVISRGITGLKLYMVSPFLASLKSWISAHQPPVPSKPDFPLKGMSVWKAKNNSTGSSSSFMTTVDQQSQLVKSGGADHCKPKNSSTGSSGGSTMVVESQVTNTKPGVDTTGGGGGPGRSLRNFRFDTARIFQAVETAFSSSS